MLRIADGGREAELLPTFRVAAERFGGWAASLEPGETLPITTRLAIDQ